MKRLTGWRKFLTIMSLLGLLAPCSLAFAIAADSEDWPSLSVREFVQEVKKTLRSESTPASTRQAAATQSAERLTQLGPDEEMPYDCVLMLYHWAEEALTAAQKAALAPRLTLPTEAIPSWTGDTVKRVFVAQYATEVSPDQQRQLLVTWLSEKTDVADYQVNASVAAWLVRKIQYLEATVPEASLAALREHAVTLLAGEELDDVAYEDAITLFEWAQNDLSAENRVAVAGKLATPVAAAEEIKAWKLRELRSNDSALTGLGVSRESRDAMVAQWVDGNQEKLENVPVVQQLAWLAARLRHSGIFSSTFSVTWNGYIKAPSTGDYTFSILPIDVNLDHRGVHIEQSVSVSVGGEQIIDAKAGGVWQHESQVVSLQAGQPQSLHVELRYSDSSSGAPRLRGVAAVLMWQRAGQPKAVVPRSAFLPPGQTGVGLEAEYRVQVDSGEVVTTRMELALDRVWMRQDPVLGSHRELVPALAAQLLARVSDESFLALAEKALSDGDKETGAKVRETLRKSLQALFGTESQSAFLALLTSRPALLYWMPQPASLYQATRFDSPAVALELLGHWAHQHAEATPEFTLDSFETNRSQWRRTAELMTWQQAEQYDLLDQQYLVMSDGSCCLPVAYVVAYASYSLGTIEQWVDRLDAMLEGPQLEGDVRVSWLIARAHAEEILRGRSGRHHQTHERLLAGIGYLQEASLVAQSRESKLQAYREMVVRYGAQERISDALALVDKARRVITDPDSAETFSAWQKELEGIGSEIVLRRQQREQLAVKAYIERLRGRYQEAVASENQDKANRYRALLIEAGADVE